MKVLIIGAVKTTASTIEKLLQHKFEVSGVIGHEPIHQEKVSGWVDLKKLSDKYNLPYLGFQKINDPSILDWAKLKNPDIIFAVGFSQLLDASWMNISKLGCIGFHPTQLPAGRGRAPIAWIILEERKGAATFFLMGTGADDGPIFVQSPFVVDETDDAKSIESKINQHIDFALDEWLPKLKKGDWNPQIQDENLSSYYGARNESDGWIDWNLSAVQIDRLIKASAPPHPGAYYYFKSEKHIILSSRIETQLKIKGVIGKVLLMQSNEALVQCGDGLIWINQWKNESQYNQIKIGDRLQFHIQDEIYKIWNKINNI